MPLTRSLRAKSCLCRWRLTLGPITLIPQIYHRVYTLTSNLILSASPRLCDARDRSCLAQFGVGGEGCRMGE